MECGVNDVAGLADNKGCKGKEFVPFTANIGIDFESLGPNQHRGIVGEDQAISERFLETIMFALVRMMTILSSFS